MRGIVVLGLVGASCVACNGTSNDQVTAPTVVAMLDTVAPAYDDQEVQIYQVSSPVELPIRRPDDSERASGKVDPYPRPPFDNANDVRTTVRFTLTNLDDAPHTVELLLDPWNEFVRYQPGFVVGDEATTPNLSGIDRFFVIAGKSRIEGIITPDDMAEMATDLGTAMVLKERPPAADSPFAGPSLYNRAFSPQNRSSERDVVLAGSIPAVAALITGFDLGLRTYEKAKLAVEITIDVEDVAGNRAVADGDTAKKFGRPGTVLTPPKPPTTP